MTDNLTPRIIFAQNLSRFRHSNNLSQEALVTQLNLLGSPLSREMYKYIETGHGNIKVYDLIALKQVYDIPYEKFFHGISPSSLPKSSITMLLTNPPFCTNLRKLRKENRFTQQALVNKMNQMGCWISQSAYAMIENGQRHLKTTDLVCLKHLYGVDYGEFFRQAGYEDCLSHEAD